MPPKRTQVASAAAALSKVQTLETTHMGSNDGNSKESNHRSDVPDEPEGSLINLGLDLNPDIDCVLVLEKGFSELSNTTQESLDMFTNANHAFRDSIQSQVDTLLMAVQALSGLNSPMGPSPVPPLDPAPVPTTGRMAGPLPGTALASAMKPNMLDHTDSASHD